MRLYFPDSAGQIDWVGYNHAVALFKKALGEHLTDSPEGADYRVYCNLPWYHKPRELKSDGLPLMVYTMYESDRVPSRWVRFLNNHADVVVVPSEWCRWAFEKSGVTAPVHVLSLGYDDERIKKVPKTKSTDEYVFMWQGVAVDPNGRKGYDIAVRAFKELRTEDRLGPDAKLVVKVRPNEHSELEIPNLETTLGVRYIQKDMSRGALIDLYREVDCCLNPTHGEGFGLIPLEQMAMGKPVLVTDWSMPYVQRPYCIPLKYTLKRSPVHWNHLFLAIGIGGIAFNAGGLFRQFRFLPKLLSFVADGRRVVKLMPPGIAPPRIPFWKSVGARLRNLCATLQRVTGLYHKPGRKVLTLFQENPGHDAFVDVEDLKNRMEWCYKNRAAAEDVGFMAHEQVSRFWTLERMRSDFENLSRELSKEKGQ